MAASVYVHIPFCSHKCDFCDFTAFAGLDHLAKDYCSALCKEIEQRLSINPNLQPIATIYYGGGTPGLIAPELLDQIHSTLSRHLQLQNNLEVSIETTPDTVSAEATEQWNQIGINRLSIGIESLQDNELSAMGRGQGRLAALAGLENARTSCFKNVSLDLMYGLPCQTIESWIDTLALALSFGFPHLSAYGLMVAANSPLRKRFGDQPTEYSDERLTNQSSAYPSDEISCRMYNELVTRCDNAGLRQYEISNFARPGFECGHNQTYWANDEYLAFGVGAHRYVAGVRSSNTRSLKQYLDNCLTLEMEESIDAITRFNEEILLALRTRSGINFNNFQLRHGIDLKVRFASTIEKLLVGGFVELDNQRMRLSQQGVMVSNLVLSEFF